jgi:dTDP-4-amino-4,6-dideoxygalactose transaminase
MGPEVQGLEEEIAVYCDATHAIGCGSGSDALLLSLMALKRPCTPTVRPHRWTRSSPWRANSVSR